MKSLLHSADPYGPASLLTMLLGLALRYLFFLGMLVCVVLAAVAMVDDGAVDAGTSSATLAPPAGVE
jgi:hypothetical protein